MAEEGFNDESQDTNIPDNIRKQGEEADKLLNNQKPVIEGIVKEPVVEEPEVEPIVEPVVDDVVVVPDEGGKDYEQMYNTLKGKYDVEIDRLNGTVEHMQGMLDQLLANPVVNEPAKKEEPIPELKKLNPDDYEDIELYMRDVGDRVNLQADENAKLKGDLDEANKKINFFQDTYAKGEKKTFEGQLAEAVPDWEVINDDHDWKAWLLDSEYEESMGLRRQDIILNAQAKGNPKPIIKLLTEFKEFKTPVKKINEKKLSDEVIPGTSAPIVEQGKPAITRAEFNKAVKDANSGKISQDDFSKIANKFQTAIANGAVV